ncbi:MAG: hypothetical protein U9N14_06395, partial [Pseudomonadota bacterium]|nr:hypothetical protein [Pseudomonadota bacterium]
MGKHVRRRKRLGTIGALGMLVLLVFAAVNMGYTILILIGMAPAIVAYIVDHGREKTATLCVGLLNFCGVLPFAIELYRNFDSSPDGALTILNTPGNWLVMYGAAA